MSGFLVWSITNVWHQKLSLKAPPYSVVNTLGFPPVWLQKSLNDQCCKKKNIVQASEMPYNKLFKLVYEKIPVFELNWVFVHIKLAYHKYCLNLLRNYVFCYCTNNSIKLFLSLTDIKCPWLKGILFTIFFFEFLTVHKWFV